MRDLLNAQWIRKTVLILHFLALFGLIMDYGFNLSAVFQQIILAVYIAVLFAGSCYTILKHWSQKQDFRVRVFVFDAASVLFIIFCLYKQFTFEGTVTISHWLRWAVLLKLIRGFVNPSLNYKRSFLNPAQLFIISFLGLVLAGSLLLMLPKATYNGISFIDALFTSTSAVCVTGLIVVDTSTYYTQFGQTLIMLLIQAGGLGILTFASYFSYFFKGGSTYENQIALSNITNSGKISEVFTTVKRILLITFLVEGLGAALIFFSLNPVLIPSFSDRVYFSVFHAISAFCNAGFSTLSNGIAEQGYVFNYPLQLTIVLLFVFGGMGFPIVINSLRYIKYIFLRHLLWFVSKKKHV